MKGEMGLGLPTFSFQNLKLVSMNYFERVTKIYFVKILFLNFYMLLISKRQLG